MIKKLQARGETRKCRGFGFVMLESEEMQQKAVAEMNGKQVGDSEIAVKVAIDSPDRLDQGESMPAHPNQDNNSIQTMTGLPAPLSGPAPIEASA